MDELEELTAEVVHCRRCGHGYPAHDDGGGHCRSRTIGWGSIESDLPCLCTGFRWVAPDVPSGGYGGAPSPAYG